MIIEHRDAASWGVITLKLNSSVTKRSRCSAHSGLPAKNTNARWRYPPTMEEVEVLRIKMTVAFCNVPPG